MSKSRPQKLNPRRIEGAYVFTFLPSPADWKDLPVYASIREEEGISLLMVKEDADRLNLAYEGVFAMVTLQIFSDLSSVGLTAKVSSALAKQNIACNVIAAFHHDHLLIPYQAAETAMRILTELTDP